MLRHRKKEDIPLTAIRFFALWHSSNTCARRHHESCNTLHLIKWNCRFQTWGSNTAEHDAGSSQNDAAMHTKYQVPWQHIRVPHNERIPIAALEPINYLLQARALGDPEVILNISCLLCSGQLRLGHRLGVGHQQAVSHKEDALAVMPLQIALGQRCVPLRPRARS